METTEILPGLWQWSLPHPAWTPEQGGATGWPQIVVATYFEPPAPGVVLIDPLVPEDAEEHARFFRALDRDVERRDGPVVVLIGNRWHGRSAAVILDRYRVGPGCEVLAHEDAAKDVQARLTGTFGDDAQVAPGVRALRLRPAGGGECAFWLASVAALVFADALLGEQGGEARLQPPSWGPSDVADYENALRSRLGLLLDLPCERLLMAHGPSVLADGRAALERALLAPHHGAAG
jgi:hypothetical protein